MDSNDYGTPVSVHICDDCGTQFTVCPPGKEDWGGCLHEDCESYDINRDVMAKIFFGCTIHRRGTGDLRRIGG
jgi:hypothetical protein